MKSTTPWVIWFITTLIILLSTRNPVYILIILVGCFIIGFRLSRENKPIFWMKQNLRFLFTMIALSALINGLFTHIGSTQIMTIPQNWPLIGGHITLESIVYGAINGFVIGALYLIFNVLNLALSIKQLTNLIPRAFYPIAMMTTIALTFFPSIQQRAREIKEAQMIRGNTMKKVTDWLPIMMPLLISSLEDAFLLSESMIARGFHTLAMKRDARIPIITLLIGVLAVFSGLVLNLYNSPRIIFIPLYLLGVVIISAVIWKSSRNSQVTKYHQESWQRNDIITVAIMLLTLAIFIFLRLSQKLPTLAYTPYPTLSIPEVSLIPILFCVLIWLPIAWISHDQA